MIWVLAGTWEGRKLIAMLAERGYEVVATCTSSRGAELARASGATHVIAAALRAEEMRELLSGMGVRAVIDCTHPFAAQASLNAIAACRAEGTPYLRLERAPLRSSPVQVQVRSFAEAGRVASRLGRRVMYTAGIKNLGEFLRHCSSEVVVRVLPSSAAKALELGVDERMLLCLHPPLSPELEKALLRHCSAEVLVMKDSGAAGGAETKLRACEELGIRAVVVQRPAVHYPESCRSLQEAVRWAEQKLKGI